MTDFKKQSRINGLHNEILLLYKRIKYGEQLNAPKTYINGLKDRLQEAEETLDKLEAYEK